MPNTLLRIIIDALLLIGIFFVPWWLVLAVGIVCLFWFDYFIEIVIVAALIDVLFSPHAQTLLFSSYMCTLGAALLYSISPFLKRRLRFYNEG